MVQLQTYMQGIETLRNVEWSKSYLWDVKFLGGADQNLNPPPPSPFDTWFPAGDYSETALHAMMLPMPFYINTYMFLKESNSTTIQMSIHDDIYGTLYKWFSDWHKVALNDGDGVAMLEDCYRELKVMKTDSMRNPIRLYTYYVIPDGSISENLNSSPDTKIYNVGFAVIGRLEPEEYDNSAYLQETVADSLSSDQFITGNVPTFSFDNLT